MTALISSPVLRKLHTGYIFLTLKPSLAGEGWVGRFKIYDFLLLKTKELFIVSSPDPLQQERDF